MYWLDAHGVDYETIDVMADEAAYDEMIRLSGQELAPVLEVEGEILADFGPDQLPEFWRRLEKKNAGIELRCSKNASTFAAMVADHSAHD